MREEQKPSETVERLRETFEPMAAKLKPEDEPALVYESARFANDGS